MPPKPPHRPPASISPCIGTGYSCCRAISICLHTGGVNIHRYKGTGYGYTSYIKTLADGVAFTDSANGITVSQVSHGGSNATVQISFGCAALTPTVALSPATLTVRPGAAASFSVAVTNQDAASCGGTTFSLACSGAAAGTVTPASLTLAAGQSSSGALAVNSNLADGRYTLTVSATDADGVAPNHGTSDQGSTTLTVDGTLPSVPTGLKGSVDRQGRISLSWLVSSDALSGGAGYTVYRNGAAIGQVVSASYTDTTAVAATTYDYTVDARDVAGNVSAVSGKVTVTASKSGKK